MYAGAQAAGWRIGSRGVPGEDDRVIGEALLLCLVVMPLVGLAVDATRFGHRRKAVIWSVLAALSAASLGGLLIEDLLETELLVAVRSGHTRIVRTLVASSFRPDRFVIHRLFGCDPGPILIGARDVETARALMDAGADCNARELPSGRTALMRAASTGRSDLVRLLLERGADPMVRDASGATAVDYARRAPQKSEIEALLAGAPPPGP
jgi:hypothetical protein